MGPQVRLERATCRPGPLRYLAFTWVSMCVICCRAHCFSSVAIIQSWLGSSKAIDNEQTTPSDVALVQMEAVTPSGAHRSPMPSPMPVMAFQGKQIINIVCGKQFALAVDSNGAVYRCVASPAVPVSFGLSTLHFWPGWGFGGIPQLGQWQPWPIRAWRCHFQAISSSRKLGSLHPY